MATAFYDSLFKSETSYASVHVGCSSCKVEFGEKYNPQDDRIEKAYFLYKHEGKLRYKMFDATGLAKNIVVGTSTLLATNAKKRKLLFYRRNTISGRLRSKNLANLKYLTSGPIKNASVNFKNWSSHFLIVADQLDYNGHDLQDEDFFKAFKTIADTLISYSDL